MAVICVTYMHDSSIRRTDSAECHASIPQLLSDELADPGQHKGQGQKQWAALKGNKQRQKAGV